jgi:hypothetical protein
LLPGFNALLVDSFVVEIYFPIYIELRVFIVMFSRLGAIFGSSPLSRPYSLRHSSAPLAATIAFVVRLRPSNSASYVLTKLALLIILLLKVTISFNKLAALSACFNEIDSFLLRCSIQDYFQLGIALVA